MTCMRHHLTSCGCLVLGCCSAFCCTVVVLGSGEDRSFGVSEDSEFRRIVQKYKTARRNCSLNSNRQGREKWQLWWSCGHQATRNSPPASPTTNNQQHNNTHTHTRQCNTQAPAQHPHPTETFIRTHTFKNSINTTYKYPRGIQYSTCHQLGISSTQTRLARCLQAASTLLPEALIQTI
jgi:hypothetical protein